MTFVFTVLGIIVVLLIINLSDWFRIRLRKKRLVVQKINERWGEAKDPVSGVGWSVGRTLFKDRKRIKNSLPYLEELGFTFLGYGNEKIIYVEPPLGWEKEVLSDLWSRYYDENKKLRFMLFYKNDIMNMSDYRVEIHHVS